MLSLNTLPATQRGNTICDYQAQWWTKEMKRGNRMKVKKCIYVFFLNCPFVFLSHKIHSLQMHFLANYCNFNLFSTLHFPRKILRSNSHIILGWVRVPNPESQLTQNETAENSATSYYIKFIKMKGTPKMNSLGGRAPKWPVKERTHKMTS